MINIRYKEIKKNSKDLGEQLKIQVVNGAAEQFSDYLKKEVKDKKCQNHGSSTRGLIEVKADMKKMIVINKSNFCCNDLSESIDISFKR